MAYKVRKSKLHQFNLVFYISIATDLYMILIQIMSLQKTFSHSYLENVCFFTLLLLYSLMSESICREAFIFLLFSQN